MKIPLAAHHDPIEALKVVYLKHHCDDEDIGWEELSECLMDCLTNNMGTEAFCKFIKEVYPDDKD